MAGIGIVVLAAGRSTRFAAGRASKLLALVGDIPIVRLAVNAATDAQVGEVVVITGDRSDDVTLALAGLPARVVREPQFGDGMATSLGRGVRELSTADAIIVTLGDVPGVRPETYRLIAARWRATGAAIVVPRYANATAPAPPTLFGSALFDELLALRGDVGARSVIARHASVVVEEPIAWPAPRDVDTLDDLNDYLTGNGRDETSLDR
jgi:molybdenum cofactor cytidylyltransferase